MIFAAGKGTITGRFVLKIGSVTTGFENMTANNTIFNIYQANSQINIQTLADEWEGKTGSVRLLDLSGRMISDKSDAGFSKNSLTQLQSPGAKGLYIVEIRAGAMRYVGKVVIR